MENNQRDFGSMPLRLLLLDGTPGAAALLLLAAHRAIPAFDHVLLPDTGWYPAAAQARMRQLEQIAARSGIPAARIDAAAAPEALLGGLPLYTRRPDGAEEQVPTGCGARQLHALAAHLQRLLDLHDPAPGPGGIAAECALGSGSEPVRTFAVGTHRVRITRPRADLGWSDTDCRAYLAHHDIDPAPGWACIACPNRGNADWTVLRAADAWAWQEALAVDTLVRTVHPALAPRSLPVGTACYLHPDRVPLDEADLSAERPEPESCIATACRGNTSDAAAPGGGAA